MAIRYFSQLLNHDLSPKVSSELGPGTIKYFDQGPIIGLQCELV